MVRMTRTDFTTPPHPAPALATQPSWVLGAQAFTAAIRRIWSVRSTRVSPLCWRWLTAGFGPPWQGEQG